MKEEGYERGEEPLVHCGKRDISADDQKRLFVLESVFNEWADVLLFFFL